MNRLFICFSLIFVTFQSIEAKEIGFWRYWTVNDGLDEAWCASITVGPNGDVWISHGEANQFSIHYDGYTMHPFPKPGFYTPIYEGPEFTLWNAIRNNPGLIRYFKAWQKGLQGKWISYSISPSKGLDELIPIDQHRAYYLSEDRKSICEFNVLTERVTVRVDLTDTPLGEIDSIFPSRKGGAWINGEIALGYISNDDNELQTWNYPTRLEQKPLTFYGETKNGILLGFSRLEEKKIAAIEFNGHSFRIQSGHDTPNTLSLIDISDGRFILEEGNILIPRSGESVVSQRSQVMSGVSNYIELEDDGIVWFGTDLGLARYTPAIWQTPAPVQSIQSVVHAVHEDRHGTIWFLCRDRLAAYQDNRWEQYVIPDGRVSMHFYSNCLASLPDGRMFFPSFKSLKERAVTSFNPASQSFELMDYISDFPQRNYVKQLSSNRLIINLVKSPDSIRLDFYDGQSYETVLEEKNGIKVLFGVRDTLLTRDETLWIGSFNGAFRFREGKEIPFPDEAQSPSGACTSLMEDNQRTIWAGYTNQVWQFDGNQWKLIRENMGRVCKLIQASDGSIWVASFNGLHHLKDGSWLTYTEEDGLPSTTVYDVIEDRNGNLWAGTANGLTRFHPEADRDRPITIVDPNNPDQIAPSGEGQFFFSGIDKWNYTDKNRLYYSYRVDEEPWSEFTTRNVAHVSQLEPREHVFHVRAMDRNRNISIPQTMKFQVPLLWYREPAVWISGLIGSILILALAALAIQRHTKLRLSYETLRRTQKQLIQSEKMASLGQLVGGVAHEINNPINFIKSNIEPLKHYLNGFKSYFNTVKENQEKITKELQTELETIETENELDYAVEDSPKLIQSFEEGSARIKKIVSDLQQYIRIEHDFYSTFDVHEAIDSSLDLLDNLYQERLSVFKDYGDIPQIRCASGQINQVFVNVLKNAAEFIEGEGSVQISTSLEKDCIVVRIQDDGIGIPAENLSKVFDPFFTTKSVGSGTGLGLSLSYGIIERHEGTLTVESEIGKGTLFTVKLPLSK